MCTIADDRYSQIFVQLEQYAKVRERGLWATESSNSTAGATITITMIGVSDE